MIVLNLIKLIWKFELVQLSKNLIRQIWPCRKHQILTHYTVRYVEFDKPYQINLIMECWLTGSYWIKQCGSFKFLSSFILFAICATFLLVKIWLSAVLKSTNFIVTLFCTIFCTIFNSSADFKVCLTALFSETLCHVEASHLTQWKLVDLLQHDASFYWEVASNRFSF